MNAGPPPSRSSEILKLDAKRQALEIEAKAITDELTQPTIDDEGRRTKPMGVDTPLVDEEGYPRSDIDVYRARDLRKRLNEIRYDYKKIMKQIESKLNSNSSSTSSVAPSKASSSTTTTTKTTTATVIDNDELQARKAPKPKPKFDKATGKWVVCNWDGTVAGVENGHLRSFENLDSSTNATASSASASTTGEPATENASVEKSFTALCTVDDTKNGATATTLSHDTALLPFATINEIADNGPAARGGLKLSDTIIQIGPVNHTNHRDLQAVGEAVHGAFLAGEMITFVVQRKNTSSEQLVTLKIEVKPGRWEGNGILGCRVVKVK